MPIESLQKIISLENELYAAHQVEQEKAVVWLKEQQDEILHQHMERLNSLEEKKAEVKARAVGEAKLKASALIHKAKDHADLLRSIEDAVLCRHLEKILKLLAGRVP